MGPAKRPPVLALTSSFTPLINTEMAYRGALAGANAVIHACERWRSPSGFNCAVPVLAATGIPLANFKQHAAVPDSVTPTISCVKDAAVVADIGVFHTEGVVATMGVPDCVRVSRTTNGFIIWPAFATDDVIIVMCRGVICTCPCPNP